MLLPIYQMEDWGGLKLGEMFVSAFPVPGAQARRDDASVHQGRLHFFTLRLEVVGQCSRSRKMEIFRLNSVWRIVSDGHSAGNPGSRDMWAVSSCFL
jgi:hypothetical protein